MIPIPHSLLRGYLMSIVNDGFVEYPGVYGGDYLFEQNSSGTKGL